MDTPNFKYGSESDSVKAKRELESEILGALIKNIVSSLDDGRMKDVGICTILHKELLGTLRNIMDRLFNGATDAEAKETREYLECVLVGAENFYGLLKNGEEGDKT